MNNIQEIYWHNNGAYEAEWAELNNWSEKQGSAEATKDYLPKGYLFARAVRLYNMLYRNGGSNIDCTEWHKVFRGISLKEARYDSPINLNNNATKAIEERLEFLLLKAYKEYKKEEKMQAFAESRWDEDFQKKYDAARSDGLCREEADRAGTEHAMEMRSEYRRVFKK